MDRSLLQVDLKEDEIIPCVLVVIEPGYGSSHGFSPCIVLTIAYPQRIILGISIEEVTCLRAYDSILIQHLRTVKQLKACRENCTILLSIEPGVGLSQVHMEWLIQEEFKPFVKLIRPLRPYELTKSIRLKVLSQKEAVSILRNLITSPNSLPFTEADLLNAENSTPLTYTFQRALVLIKYFDHAHLSTF